MTSNFLIQALKLAEIRQGFCAPNPSVGALVVKDGEIIGQGFHFGAGHPHAEVEALKNIPDASGATLYVTLEPCCHTGKTPPCTDLIIEKKIKEVVFGFRDPNPLVAHKSETILKNAGITVHHHPLAEINAFYISYSHWWKTKMPYVTAKIAMSINGKIAGENGERITISGKKAQKFTHQQRKKNDAILTTAKTIIQDNPLLNVRLEKETIKKPLYVLDSHLSIPTSSHVFSSTSSITLFHRHDVSPEKIEIYTQQGAHCIAVGHNESGLILEEVLKIIGSDGHHQLWVETGGQCFSAFIQQKLTQHAFVYIAPCTIEKEGINAFNQNISFINTAKKSWEILGEDVVCELTWNN